MERELDLLRQTRNNFISAIESLSESQMMVIPKGLNNNIFWNLGHILVTQQLLCYRFSGLPVKVPDEFVSLFKKGTSPVSWTNTPAIARVKSHMLSSIEDLYKDYHSGEFKQYKPFKTHYGFSPQCIEDAIRMNNVHEALHLGMVEILKKLVLAEEDKPGKAKI